MPIGILIFVFIIIMMRKRADKLPDTGGMITRGEFWMHHDASIFMCVYFAIFVTVLAIFMYNLVREHIISANDAADKIDKFVGYAFGVILSCMLAFAVAAVWTIVIAVAID